MKNLWPRLFVIIALSILASSQEQAGQPCHSNKKDPLFGMYCPTINGSFVGPKNSIQLNTTTIINGVITSITGSERTCFNRFTLKPVQQLSALNVTEHENPTSRR